MIPRNLPNKGKIFEGELFVDHFEDTDDQHRNAQAGEPGFSSTFQSDVTLRSLNATTPAPNETAAVDDVVKVGGTHLQYPNVTIGASRHHPVATPLPKSLSTESSPMLFAQNGYGKFGFNPSWTFVSFQPSVPTHTLLATVWNDQVLTARVIEGHWYIYPHLSFNFFLSRRSKQLGFDNGLYAFGDLERIQDYFRNSEPTALSIGDFHYWRRDAMFGHTPALFSLYQ